jgi:phage-related baseplate assembly protein
MPVVDITQLPAPKVIEEIDFETLSCNARPD